MLHTTTLLLLVLAACADGKNADSNPIQGGESCTALSDGSWTLSGPAWGMGDNTMTGEVTMNSTACTFELNGYDMQMDDLPTGGAVDVDQVQLDGLTSYWRSCIGIAADQTSVSGTCSDDGAEFVMTMGDSL